MRPAILSFLGSIIFYLISSGASADVLTITVQGPTVTQEVFVCELPDVREKGSIALGFGEKTCNPYLLAGFLTYAQSTTIQNINGIFLLELPIDNPIVFKISYEAKLFEVQKPVVGGNIYIGVSGQTSIYNTDETSGAWVTVDGQFLDGSAEFLSLVLNGGTKTNEAQDAFGPLTSEVPQIPSSPMTQSAGVNWNFETSGGLITLQFDLQVGDLEASQKVGDLNLDGEVGTQDLEILFGFWGSVKNSFDLTNDGLVDGADLGLLLAGFGSPKR